MIQHIRYQALKIKTNCYCVIALFVLENNVTLFKLLMKTELSGGVLGRNLKYLVKKNQMKIKLGDPK
jgi:hypothetical protein